MAGHWRVSQLPTGLTDRPALCPTAHRGNPMPLFTQQQVVECVQRMNDNGDSVARLPDLRCRLKERVNFFIDMCGLINLEADCIARKIPMPSAEQLHAVLRALCDSELLFEKITRELESQPMPVLSSQMGNSHAPDPASEEPIQDEDESIFLTREQIKAMSEEEIHTHLEKLNALRSTPKTARKAKVTATGAAVPRRGSKEIL